MPDLPVRIATGQKVVAAVPIATIKALVRDMERHQKQFHGKWKMVFCFFRGNILR